VPPAAPPPSATATVPSPAVPPSAKVPLTTVAVLNAARSSGLARTEADRLFGAGYAIGVVASAPGGRHARSSVLYAPGARAATVRPLTGRARAGREADVLVVLGADRRR
jgi:hypothetical protein